MTRSPARVVSQCRIRCPGKTTFLKFTLTRLISERQVIVLCDNSEIYLFYQGKVYFRPETSGFEGLPEHQQTRYCPIWALIDVDYKGRESSITRRVNIWPIQASPSNPILWKAWLKQQEGALLGLPPWNMEDLMEGYVFSLISFSAVDPGSLARWRFIADCPSFLLQFMSSPQLRRSSRQTWTVPLALSNGSTPPATHDETIDLLLEVLQGEREREKAEEREGRREQSVKKRKREAGDTVSASAVDQAQNMADDASQPQAPVDNVGKAFKTLVRNATEEFGFAPRDVYAGVFRLTKTKSEHTTEVQKLNYSTVKAIVEAYSKMGELPGFSHRLVAVYPRYVRPDHDEWVIDFKSIGSREKWRN